MITERIADLVIALPNPLDIPVPKTRAALEAALAAKDARQQAHRDRDAADAFARDAGNSARISDLADALDAGAEVADPSGALEDAKKAATAAQEMLTARTEQETRRMRELRAAVAEEAEQWAAVARHNGASAVRKLTTAHAMATQARTDLLNSLGVSAMLEGRAVGDVSLTMRSRPNGYTFPLEEALEALRDAVAAAATEQATYDAAAKEAAKTAKATKKAEVTA